jgi:hypothetical protein
MAAALLCKIPHNHQNNVGLATHVSPLLFSSLYISHSQKLFAQKQFRSDYMCLPLFIGALVVENSKWLRLGFDERWMSSVFLRRGTLEIFSMKLMLAEEYLCCSFLTLCQIL